MDRDWIPWVIRGSAAGAAAIWGGLAPVIQVLVLLMVLDVATGFLAAYVTATIDSGVSFRGMARKAIVLLLVGAASALEAHVDLPIGLGTAVAGFYSAHELISLLENATRAGLPVPEALQRALTQLSPDEPARRGGGES